ncbi:hypothetical protein [Rhizobium sp. HT1-10]|uniref:hypothetical protein n=1 Tax=Rhizobium sp. HT1-10 TaxID=3111638 RepID=UPI003C138BE6
MIQLLCKLGLLSDKWHWTNVWLPRKLTDGAWKRGLLMVRKVDGRLRYRSLTDVEMVDYEKDQKDFEQFIHDR